ncbi:hypothetical protein NE237_012642 [Protea cynaroides]|uniref:Secreted protein n=1 Tax=Protea cynaroides TaxID=273540 RepID=A0A9Q0GYD5_9MAGN|nr:hypothetical protein NE237_012642 [Protea cynaroides]
MLLGLLVLVPRFLPSSAMPLITGDGDLNCSENRIDLMIFFYSDLRFSLHFSSAPNNFCRLSMQTLGMPLGSHQIPSAALPRNAGGEFSGKLMEFDCRISAANVGLHGTSQENLRRSHSGGTLGSKKLRIRRLTVPSKWWRLFVTTERILNAIFVFHDGFLRSPKIT